MSLRPEISGFSLQKMFDLIGCKDEAVLPSLYRELDASLTVNDSDLAAEAHSVLQRAVFEARDWQDLEFEEDSHVLAAITLAAHGQEHLKTESNIWTMDGICDFVEECYLKIPQESESLSVFMSGRPIFGGRISTSWSYYGYLAQQEVAALLSVISRFREGDPTRKGRDYHYGVVDELVNWLHAIQSNDLDLWFYCA